VKKSDGTVLAEITFGEATLPSPPDGSIAMNMMHFRFTPASGISGESDHRDDGLLTDSLSSGGGRWADRSGAA
jgi:hypothetical protein